MEWIRQIIRLFFLYISSMSSRPDTRVAYFNKDINPLYLNGALAQL